MAIDPAPLYASTNERRPSLNPSLNRMNNNNNGNYLPTERSGYHPTPPTIAPPVPSRQFHRRRDSATTVDGAASLIGSSASMIGIDESVYSLNRQYETNTQPRRFPRTSSKAFTAASSGFVGSGNNGSNGGANGAFGQQISTEIEQPRVANQGRLRQRHSPHPTTASVSDYHHHGLSPQQQQQQQQPHFQYWRAIPATNYVVTGSSNNSAISGSERSVDGVGPAAGAQFQRRRPQYKLCAGPGQESLCLFLSFLLSHSPKTIRQKKSLNSIIFQLRWCGSWVEVGPLPTSSSASSEAIRIEANFFLWGLFYFTFFHYG